MGVKWHRQPCGDLALPTLGADVANAAFGEAKVGGWVGTCGQADRKEEEEEEEENVQSTCT